MIIIFPLSNVWLLRDPPVLTPMKPHCPMQNWLHITVGAGGLLGVRPEASEHSVRLVACHMHDAIALKRRAGDSLDHKLQRIFKASPLNRFTHFFGGASPGVDVVSKQLVAYLSELSGARDNHLVAELESCCAVFCCAQRLGGTSEPPCSGLSSWHVPDKSRKEHTFEKCFEANFATGFWLSKLLWKCGTCAPLSTANKGLVVQLLHKQKRSASAVALRSTGDPCIALKMRAVPCRPCRGSPVGGSLWVLITPRCWYPVGTQLQEKWEIIIIDDFIPCNKARVTV